MAQHSPIFEQMHQPTPPKPHSLFDIMTFRMWVASAQEQQGKGVAKESI
jgi:hypothetical protein